MFLHLAASSRAKWLEKSQHLSEHGCVCSVNTTTTITHCELYPCCFWMFGDHYTQHDALMHTTGNFLHTAQLLSAHCTAALCHSICC